MNLLLDTNVFIDYLGRKEPFFPPAQKIVMAAFFGDVKLWVPAQSAVDAFYVLSRYVDTEPLQKAILKALELITPVDLTAADLERAARLSWPDLEDCLIALAADKAQADYLVTRDAKGFARSLVPPVSPAEWLEIMRRERGLVYEEAKF
ncbi:PIN domain-containing protein [uncultured Adlercreutzia sp.]|uniref:type II toxin-antitoxin system VapC family toxin n=1 Tax=uncultured Adlercreutzia sp. TaxID=875803 RepID=UPI0025F6A4F2|nr:PIN domain-containing protein [uncultured Adlercreutzia sp.]